MGTKSFQLAVYVNFRDEDFVTIAYVESRFRE